MPKVRMVMYCEIADAGPDEPWLEKFVESFGSFPPGAVITTNVDQEVSPDAENLARLRERSPDLDGRGICKRCHSTTRQSA
jgi:hypothetical protein